LNLSLESLSFSRQGKPVLKGISASIPGEGLTCLLGANGAGKTTLLRILSGELKGTSGRFLVGDKDGSILSREELSTYFAVIPQSVPNPPYLTVSELVGLGRFRPKKALWWRLSDQDRRIVRSCLKSCQLDDLAERQLDQLSGGEQQRGWLAFGLAQGKPFLLLDETLDGMDVFVKRSFFQLLKNVAAYGRGVLLTSHDLGLVEEFADKVLVLSGGKISYDGPPQANLQEAFSS